MTVKGCSSRSVCCPAVLSASAPRPRHVQLSLAWCLLARRQRRIGRELLHLLHCLQRESVHALGGNKDGRDAARSVKMSFLGSQCFAPSLLPSPSRSPFLQPFPLSSCHCLSLCGGFTRIFCLLPAVFTVTGFLTSHESHSQGEI